MFEIGTSLREARLRQGIDLPRVEDETKIRAKYLRALEEEHFDVLPGDTYVKGFLRTYAEYLGLDGQLYVDEYNSRFATAEEPVAATPARPRPRARAVESNLVIVALAGIVAVTVLVVVAWKFGTGAEPTTELLIDQALTAPGETAPAETEAPAATAPAESDGRETAPDPPRKARLVLSATAGDCWLQVRAGSAGGELLYEGTLQQGQTQRFTKWQRLWVQLGAPSNLSVRLNGRSVDDFPTQQSIVVVTAKRVRTVSTA